MNDDLKVCYSLLIDNSSYHCTYFFLVLYLWLLRCANNNCCWKLQTLLKVLNILNNILIKCDSKNFKNIILEKIFQFIKTVGETALPLHNIKIIHGRAISGCEHTIILFRNDCAKSSFFSQVLDTFLSAKFKNKTFLPAKRTKWLKTDDYWMNTLRIILIS